MNPLNVATLEASKRLYDAGIVLETDFKWYQLKNEDWYLSGEEMPMLQIIKELPAPSMAEVWRELPTNALPEAFNGLVRCRLTKEKEEDYLTDLLIWVRKERQCQHHLQKNH